MNEREIVTSPSIRQFILISYKELLKDSSPDKISVKQIAERAGINRSTFYLHFQDKNEVLEVIIEEKLSEFISSYYSDHQDNNNHPNYTTTQICHHIFENRKFYNGLILNKDFKKKLFCYLFEALQIHMETEALATFTAYGTMGYLFNWIEQDCEKPIEEIAHALWSIADSRFYVSKSV